MLSQQANYANLQTLTTTGVPIRIIEPGSIGQGYRYIWVHGALSNRRYEGKRIDQGLRFGTQGAEKLDGQVGWKRGMELGVEGMLAGRSNSADDSGFRRHTLGLTAGLRKGWQRDAETGFGSATTNEMLSVTNKPSHLYRYDLTLTASKGGFWRPRGLLRGVGLGLPGLIVRVQPRDILIGPARGGGPMTGQVLISIPEQHAPAVDPHADGALNPYLDPEQPAWPMDSDRALELATGDIITPAAAALLAGRGHRRSGTSRCTRSRS